MKRYEEYKDSEIEWIGEIPRDWKKIKFKFVTNLMTCGHAATPKYVEEGGRPFLSAQNIKKEEIDLSILKYVTNDLHDQLTKNHKVEKGDLLQVRVGGKDTIGQTAIAKLDFDVSIYVSLAHIKLNELAHNGFIKHLCNSVDFKDYCGVLMKKGAGVANLNISDVEIMRIPLPKLVEQTQIANYLDLKTAQLDSLISKKEQLIELLKEERTALINDCVTGKLVWNGNAWAEPAQVKDSGIEWLGEIPAHWEVLSFRFCVDVLTDFTSNGSFASLAKNVNYLDKGYSRLVRLTDLRVNLENDGLFVDENAHTFLHKSELFGGEMLIANVGAYAGLVKIMPRLDGKYTLGPNMFLLRLNQDTDFFYHQLNAPFCAEQLKMMAISSAQPKLNKDNIRQLKVVKPPLEEQSIIENKIRTETNRIDSEIIKKEKEIALLKEYKTALISEVVTGKVDVRGEVVPSTHT